MFLQHLAFIFIASASGNVLDFDMARATGTSVVHSRLVYCNSANYYLPNRS